MRRTRIKLITGIVAGVIVLAGVPAASAALHTRIAADCVRAQLGVRNNGISGALGTIHGAWVFTNRSDTACTLNGYPALQLYGPAGRPMPTTTVQDLAPTPSAVTLAPGASGTFFSSYNDVGSGPHPCQTSGVIQITAPNADAPHFIPAQLQACGGVVHVSAVKAGVHHP